MMTLAISSGTHIEDNSPPEVSVGTCGVGLLAEVDFATSASFAKSRVGWANFGEPPLETVSKSSIKSEAF